MNKITSHALALILGGAIVAGGCLYKSLKPGLPSLLSPPAKELKGEKSETLDCRPVVVYRDRVKRDLGLPETVQKDPDKKVVASSPVPPSDYPHTMTAVYDSGTGGVDMFLRQDPLGWLSFNRRGAIGVAYGIKDDATGFVTRVYGRLALVQIKRLHAGLLGDVDNTGDWYGGGFVEARW